MPVTVERSFFTKVVGVTKRNDEGDRIQDILDDISNYAYEGMPVQLEHERDNPYDENAIKVICDDVHIGYIRREIAKDIVKEVDRGELSAEFMDITGGDDKVYGCNLRIIRKWAPAHVSTSKPQKTRPDPRFESDRAYDHLRMLESSAGIFHAQPEEGHKVKRLTGKPKYKDKLWTARYLQALALDQFEDYTRAFSKWVLSLTPRSGADTIAYAGEQFKIIRDEAARRRIDPSPVRNTPARLKVVLLAVVGACVLVGVVLLSSRSCGDHDCKRPQRANRR